MRKLYNYILHDDTGVIVDKGTAFELSQKYEKTLGLFESIYKRGGKFLDKYTITREERDRTYTINYLGNDYTGTPIELQELLNLSRQTIYKYIAIARSKKKQVKPINIYQKQLEELEKNGYIVVRPWLANELKEVLGKGYTFEERETVACKERFINICIKRTSNGHTI